MDKYSIASDWEKAKLRSNTENSAGVQQRGIEAVSRLAQFPQLGVILAVPGVLGGMAKGAKRMMKVARTVAPKSAGKSSIGKP